MAYSLLPTGQGGALREAGDDLLDIIKRHNSTLYDMSYVAQSAEMKSLRAELEENRATVKQASVQPLLAEMTEAMDRFDTLYQEKLDAESGKSLPLVRETRRELAKQLGLLLNQVEILQEDEEEGVDVMIGKFNDIITDTMTTVRARQTRQENEDREEGEGF